MYVCVMPYLDIYTRRKDGIDCITRPQGDEILFVFLATVSIDAWSVTTVAFQFTPDPTFESISPSSSFAS